MMLEERRDMLLRELHLHGSVEVATMAERLKTSGMTIRRDLAYLARNGLVERVHGGAVLPAPTSRPKTGAGGGGTRPFATIGLIVPSAAYYFPDIIRGAESAAQEAGVRLVLGISNYSEEEECRQIRQLIASGRIDGLMVTPSGVKLSGTRTAGILAESPIPVVVVERSIEDVLDEGQLESVRSDHARGAEIAVNHLLSIGRKRIALCVREDGPTGFWLAEGYYRALDRAGLSHEPELVHTLPRPDRKPAENREAIDRAVQQCRDGLFDSAIVHSDEDAIQFVESAMVHGLTIPQDLAIVSYDDEIAALAGVPLSAVSPPKFDVGHQSLMLCLRRITSRSKAKPTALQRINLSPSLTVRDSTKV